MGVSGSGKSTFGSGLATRLRLPFTDADLLRPAANIEKMSAGIALDDQDRARWLTRVGHELTERDIVVACSALKRAYRDRLRELAPSFTIVYLRGERDVLTSRASTRIGHFMPAALVDSQLCTLQEPSPDEHPIVIDISQSTAAQIQQAIELLTNPHLTEKDLEQA
jgi:gluconokinase